MPERARAARRRFFFSFFSSDEASDETSPRNLMMMVPRHSRRSRAARARGPLRRGRDGESFQRLGRGRRFRKKPADEAASAPPVDGATATAAATAPRHPGLVAGEGTARARDTASPATPAPAAAPAANAAHPLRDERPSCAEGTDAFVADDYNAGPPSRPLRGSTRPGLYGQTLVSFGLADADDLFGGGVPLGSVVLVGADARDDSGRRDCGNASTLARYFLAEGVASRHAALWLAPSADRDGKNRRGAALPRRSRAATLPRLAVSGLADDESLASTSRKTQKTKNDDDGLRIAWQYRRYLQQGKALDDSRVGARGVGGLAAGVSATGGSAGPGPGSGSGKDSRKNAGGVRRLPAMCHAFDLTREAGGETARTADLRCAPIGGVRNVRNPRSLADAVKSVSFSASFAPNAKSSDDDDGLRAAFAECVRLVERCDASSETAADEDDAPVGRIVLQFPDFVDDDASAARLARFLRSYAASCAAAAAAAAARRGRRIEVEAGLRCRHLPHGIAFLRGGSIARARRGRRDRARDVTGEDRYGRSARRGGFVARPQPVRSAFARAQDGLPGAGRGCAVAADAHGPRVRAAGAAAAAGRAPAAHRAGGRRERRGARARRKNGKDEAIEAVVRRRARRRVRRRSTSDPSESCRMRRKIESA